MTNSKEVEFIIQPPGKFTLNLKELWQYRELFYYFTWRDIKVKYKQTLIGFAWVILQPILITIVFVTFFANSLEVPTSDIPPPIFYFSGLIFWNLFSSGVTGAANSMINNSNIIKKIYFPRLIIPISSTLSSVFDFFIAIIVFVFLYLFYVIQGLHFSIFQVSFYFLLAFLLALLFTFGMGVFIASVNVKYRDFRYVIPFVIQFMFFVSPVIFPLSVVTSPMLKFILSLNPMSAVLSLSRGGLIDGGLDWWGIGYGSLVSILLFCLGIYNFRKTEAYFADLA